MIQIHLHYACQVCGQSNSDILVMVQRTQNKSLRIINFKEERHPSQWLIQRLLDTGIPLWAPKLGEQIKGELMQNNNSHLTMSST